MSLKKEQQKIQTGECYKIEKLRITNGNTFFTLKTEIRESWMQSWNVTMEVIS